MLKRALILIHHKHKEFEKQAEFHYFLKNFVERYPSVDFIMPIPQIKKGLPEKPNLFYFEADYILKQTGFNKLRHLDEIYIDNRIIEQFVIKYCPNPVDVIITEKPQLVGNLVTMSSLMARQPVPIIVVEPYLKSHYRRNYQDIKQIIEYQQTLGYLSADMCLFQTDWETENAVRLAKELFFAKPTHFYTSQPKFDQPEPVDRSKKTSCVMFGQKLQAVRQPEQVQSVIYDFAKRNRSKVVYVTAQNLNSFYNKFKNTKNVKIVNLKRDGFYKLLAKSKVSFSLSKDEETARGVCEMLLRDVIVLLPKRNWVAHYFGFDYPYYITDEKKLDYELEYYLENYDEEIKKIEPVKQFILQNKDDFNVFDKLEETLPKQTFAKDFIASIQYKLPRCFKMEYIWEMAEKRNQTLRYDYAFASSYELYKALQDFNYKITTTQYGELIFTADNGNS